MDHALQVQLVHRVLAHLEHKTTDSAAAPSRLAIDAYADPVRHDREVATLFRALPVGVGHASQLAKPGDFFTHDASGVPLLVVRGDDDRIRAFLNVCRHRGTRVEGAPCGTKKAFTCPYHAWTYALHGKLLHVPHERGFADNMRDLAELPLVVIAGLIFVVPTATAGATMPADWLGTLAQDLEGFGLGTSHFYAPTVRTKALSWKLSIDVFLETYHLQMAHRASIYPMFFDNLGLVDLSGPHQRNVFPKRSIKSLADRPESEWQLRTHANVLFHLFPNTLVLVEPDHAAVLHLWPKGPGHTLLTAYTLVPEPPLTDKARAYWDKNNAILYNAIDEDFALGESIQSGLHSRTNDHVVFGAFEHALTHFHDQIARHS